MKTINNIITQVITTVLLCISFLLDYFIAISHSELLVKIISGIIFLFFIPCVLIFISVKQVSILINNAEIKFIKYSGLLFLLPLTYFHGQEVIQCRVPI